MSSTMEQGLGRATVGSNGMLAALVMVWTLGGCSQEGSVSGDGLPQGNVALAQDEVLATIEGEPVTLSELEELIGDRLAQMEFQYLSQRHQLVQAGLQEHISERLAEEEAAARGITREELMTTEVESKVKVTENDVAVWYRENQDRVQGRSLETLSPQIEKFLKEREQQRLLTEFAKRLADKNDVVYLLEPLRADVDAEGSPSFGPDDAPVTVVEFSDFECPYCSRLIETLEEVKKNYAGRVRLVFRQFPLNIHPNAFKAAEASLCANGQDKFWPMHDLLFAEQRRLGVDALKEKAGRLGLDQAGFVECLTSGRHAEQVREDLRVGTSVGVTGTPALFVNGVPLQNGAVPYEVIAQAIEDELARSEAE